MMLVMAEDSASGTTPDTKKCSPAAKRMRLYRARRSNGQQCITVIVRDDDKDALVRCKLLDNVMRNDAVAIQKALHRLMDHTFHQGSDA